GIDGRASPVRKVFSNGASLVSAEGGFARTSLSPAFRWRKLDVPVRNNLSVRFKQCRFHVETFLGLA
ncbi:MAG: hypothetical protein WBC99_00210, partial [Candidatus Omnitrophota bacterium]